MDKEQIAQSLLDIQTQILGLEQNLTMIRDGKIPADHDVLDVAIHRCAAWGVSLADIVGKILL